MFAAALSTPRPHALAAPREPEIACQHGCNPDTGECWRLLAEAHTHGLLNPPELIYVGEPYPTQQDASCGAKKLRQYGICIAIGFEGNFNVPAGRIQFTKDDEPHPGTDDCY